MKAEQYLKLQDLSERLTDVVISDADPENWIGNGINPSKLTQVERGDAYWCRKMAVASLAVLTRVATLVEIIQNQSKKGSGAAEVTDDDRELDAAVASAEKEAGTLLDKLQSRKAHIDSKKSHGKV
jgi:hypothetical protein